MPKKTLRDVDLAGRRVLVRVDFNVPLRDGQVADDLRIRAALPTLRHLVDLPAAVVLMSHLGRPKGEPRPELSLRPVARALAGLLGRAVEMAPDCVGPAAVARSEGLEPGQVVLLENLRFHPGETSNDPDFARELARHGQAYVNDAFGAAHRAHASVAGVPWLLKPAVAGLLMERELEMLGRLLEEPQRPFLAVLGGAKVSDKIGVVDRLLELADRLIIGGGMANTFLLAGGHAVGRSLVEEEQVELARRLMDRGGQRLVLPLDLVVAEAIQADAEQRVVGLDGVPDGWAIADAGPRSLGAYRRLVAGAATIFWNGPLGVFEIPAFARGTFDLARAIAASDATSVVGGGDSASAVRAAGVADRISHISTGGGASLELVEGKELPGVAALDDQNAREG